MLNKSSFLVAFHPYFWDVSQQFLNKNPLIGPRITRISPRITRISTNYK